MFNLRIFFILSPHLSFQQIVDGSNREAALVALFVATEDEVETVALDWVIWTLWEVATMLEVGREVAAQVSGVGGFKSLYCGVGGREEYFGGGGARLKVKGWVVFRLISKQASLSINEAMKVKQN